MRRIGNTGTLAAVAAAIEIAAGSNVIQLFPIGTWRGRNGLGPYTLADRAHAEAVVAATQAAQGSTDIMVDYDHQAVRAFETGGQALAAGWVRTLEARDDGIWAQVDWTAKASAHLAEREYRYASPYFRHDKAGRITRIVNAALTNTPNFNMEAVAATAIGDDMNDLEAIVAAMGLPAETTLDQVVAAIKKMKAEPAMAAVATALGLGADATEEAVAASATAIRARADAAPDPKAFVPVAQLEAVTARLTTIDGERADAAVASAIQSGKLAPALKQWGTDYFKKDEAAFASFIGSAPVILAPGAVDAGKVDPKSDTITAEERAIASGMGLSDADFLAARKEGL